MTGLSSTAATRRVQDQVVLLDRAFPLPADDTDDAAQDLYGDTAELVAWVVGGMGTQGLSVESVEGGIRLGTRLLALHRNAMSHRQVELVAQLVAALLDMEEERSIHRDGR